jgi:hypothetical protein
VENSYATGTVTGRNVLGGVVGFILTSTSPVGEIINSAALNPSITGNHMYIGRVTGGWNPANPDGILSGNRALNTMQLFSSGMPDWTNFAHDAINGADMTSADASTPAFWTTASNWQGDEGWDASVWAFAPGHLPTLKGEAIIPKNFATNVSVTLPFTFFSDYSTLHKPVLTVRWIDQILVEGTDFTVAITSIDSAQENTHLGIYGTSAGILPGVVTLLIQGLGEFTGTRTFSYTIWRPHSFAGSGTPQNPYIIATAADLQWLAEATNRGDTNFNNKHYRLAADIDLLDYGATFRGGAGWVPIGTSSNPFRGVFDGNHKTIKNLYINRTTTFVGLFGWAQNATIQNLGVEDVSIAGSISVGGIVGEMSNSHILNSHAIGTITGTGRLVGGIVGWAGNGSSIINCYAMGTINGDHQVGGIAGIINGDVILSGSHFIGDVTGRNVEIGGVVGLIITRSVISESYSEANVEGDWMVGGVAGRMDNGSSIINSYATGTVTGSNGNFGGIVGSVSNSIITNSYTTGTVIGGGGGITSSAQDGSTITRNVALNPAVSCPNWLWNTSRVMTWFDNSQLLGNYGFVGMLNNAGDTEWWSKGHDNIDGADITIAQALTASFWTTATNWQGQVWPDSAWSFADGRLPILRNAGGNQTGEIPEELKQAGATAATPLLVSRTHNSIVVVVAPPTSGQAVEVAISTTFSAPATGWQDTLTFTGLTPNTTYFIFARTKANGGFNTGEPSGALLVVTDVAPAIPPAISTPLLPNGTRNTFYSQTLVATGDETIYWALESGTPPDGVNIFVNGIMAGTPSRPGPYTFTLMAINRAGTHSRQFNITIAPSGDDDGETSINPTETVEVTSLQAAVVNGKLQVSGLIVGQRWTVYNVLGTRVFQGFATGETVEITLPIQGTYIIQQFNRTIKIVY